MTNLRWNENFERRPRHASSSSRFAIATAPSESDMLAVTDLLSELHDLLNEYAPTWYSEDLHNRIDAVVRVARSR